MKKPIEWDDWIKKKINLKYPEEKKSILEHNLLNAQEIFY